MKAIVMTECGAPDVLKLADVPVAPLEHPLEAASVHRVVEDGHTAGKVVLRVD